MAAVIVNYRTPEDTIACVRSLQAMGRPQLDICIVENDSRDGSACKLAEATALMQNVRLIVSPRNDGYTGGNNLGIERALAMGADVVLVLNPDTLVIDPTFIDAAILAFDRDERIGVIGPRVFLREKGRVQNTVFVFPWLIRRMVNAVRYRLWAVPPRSGSEQREVEVLNGVCLLYRAECLRDVGLLDDRIFAYIDEADWCYRARRKGWKAVYLPVDSIVHHQPQTGYERGSNVELLLKRNTLYFLLKHGKYVQAWLYAAMTLPQAAAISLVAISRGQRGSQASSYFGRVARSSAGLLMGRYDAVMGRPK